MTRIPLLRRSGEALFGPWWQRKLSRALGPLHPSGPRKQIDDRLIRRWLSGDRDIPHWVWPALSRLMEDQKLANLAQNELLEKVDKELREYDPEWD